MMDPQVRDMTERNLGLIGWTVGRYFPNLPESDRDEAFQDGYFGLVRAAERFDPSLGFRFSTYAVPWIRKAISRGRDAYEGANFRRADRNGANYVWPVSLDTPVADGLTMRDFLAESMAAPDEVVVGSNLLDLARVHGEAACRDDLDRAALDRLLGDRRSLRDIGAEHGVTYQTVYNRGKRIRAALAPVLEGAR